MAIGWMARWHIGTLASSIYRVECKMNYEIEYQRRMNKCTGKNGKRMAMIVVNAEIGTAGDAK